MAPSSDKSWTLFWFLTLIQKLAILRLKQRMIMTIYESKLAKLMWNASPNNNLDETHSIRQLFQILQTENLPATPCIYWGAYLNKYLNKFFFAAWLFEFRDLYYVPYLVRRSSNILLSWKSPLYYLCPRPPHCCWASSKNAAYCEASGGRQWRMPRRSRVSLTERGFSIAASMVVNSSSLPPT